ncbi:MAG: RDD family protein [Bacteriovoracaceae bacterium]
MYKRQYLKRSSERASRLSRLIAKSVDVFIALLLAFLFYPVGVLLGCFYLSISDSLQKGQSVGKKLIGFSVISLEDGSPCNFKQSFIRNLPFTLPFFLAIFPVWGWILSIILMIGFGSFEFYLIFKLGSGHRLGDVMADTSVVSPNSEAMKVRKAKSSWFENSSQIGLQ